jgi:hypothetical protein
MPGIVTRRTRQEAIMSAFLVSNATINALVWARSLCNRGMSSIMPSAGDREFGAMLLRENMRSLEERYGDAIDNAAIKAYRPTLDAKIMALPCVALIKLVHCYRYQACEHEGWEASDACKATGALESALVHMLPGYDEAAWGIG